MKRMTQLMIAGLFFVLMFDAGAQQQMTLAQEVPATSAEAKPEPVPGHKTGAHSAIFSPDGRLVASGSGGEVSGGDYDGNVYVWEVATGKALHHFETDGAYIHFSPDSRFLAVAGRTNPLDVFDLQSGQRAFSLTMDPTVNPLLDPAVARLDLFGFAFSPEGNLLAAAVNSEGRNKPYTRTILAVIWDVPSRKLVRAFPIGPGFFSGDKTELQVKFSPDGKLLALGDSKIWLSKGGFASAVSRGPRKGVIRLWDTSSWNEVRALSFPETSLFPDPLWFGEFSFSPDGKIIAAACKKSVLLWDVSSGQLARTLTGPVEFANGTTFSPDGRTLVATELDEDNAVAWDLVSGEQSARFGFPTWRHYRTLKQFGFSPDGKLLAFPASSGDTHLVEPRTGKVVRTLKNTRSLKVIGPFRVVREGPFNRYSEPTPVVPFFTKKSIPDSFLLKTCEVDLENLSDQAEYLTAPNLHWGLGNDFYAYQSGASELLMVLPVAGKGAGTFEVTLGKGTSIRSSRYRISGLPTTSVKVEPHGTATVQLVFIAPIGYDLVYLDYWR